jgi:hypothetical protein
MSALRPLSGAMWTSAGDCLTIAIYEYTTWQGANEVGRRCHMNVEVTRTRYRPDRITTLFVLECREHKLKSARR